MSQGLEEEIMADDHAERVHPDSHPSLVMGMIHALHGLKHVLLHERNARIHLTFAVAVFIMGVVLQLSPVELAAVFFAVVLVFISEIFNTAIERTLDIISIKENSRIKLIKDMAAGAVLVAAAAAVMIGVAIFAPHIVELLWPA